MGRMIDNDDIKRKLAKLHQKQLDLLLRRFDDEDEEAHYLEPQEHRLIWDMVKEHAIGLDTVEDIVEKSNKQIKGDLDAITIDGDWVE